MKNLLPIALLLLAAPAFAADPSKLPLWPDTPPGETGKVGPEKQLPPRNEKPTPIVRITDVSKPMLTVYKPETPDRLGTAVIVAPGGGYNILAYNHEGTEVCRWLNSLGITAVLLKYRVPRRDPETFYEAPLLDAQRAIRTTRAHADDWGIDPQRIGMLGFSAGGHLTVMSGTQGTATVEQPRDAIDRESAELAFMIPIYPAYLLDQETDQLDDLIQVTPSIPPAFIAITFDDAERAVGSAMLLAAMKKVDVPCELHVFRSGGHGYGLRPSDDPVSQWPALCADWLRASGYLSR